MQRSALWPALIGLIPFLAVSCHSNPSGPSSPGLQNTPSGSGQSEGNPADSLPEGASARDLPDPKMTPGDTLPVTADDVCVSGYSKKVRNVTEDVKKQAYAEYGITSHRPHEYEVDHLISLELGGSNSIKNLWPQSYETQPWNAHVKDKLENELHRLVCSGKLDLPTAQQEIARNWIAAYKKYLPNALPQAQVRRAAAARRERSEPQETPAPADPNGKVWVNTKSGAYWRPGTQYYGKTKEGQYMTEAEALQQGYHAAGEHH